MRKKNMFLVTCFIALVVLAPQFVFSQTAQEAHVSGSPNPVGSGARALGMGGAFIGIADDATAASWNPGGLIQLETPEMSLVLSYEKLYENRSFDQNPGASGDYSIDLTDINYLSLAYPFTLYMKNMIVSLNYQTLYNFNKRHKYNYTYNSSTSSQSETPFVFITTTTGLSGPRITDHDTDGYLKAISPAFSMQITPSFSLGMTLNYFHPNIGSKWDTNYFDDLQGTQEIEVAVTDKPGPPVIPPSTTTTTYTISQKTWYEDEYTFKTSINPFGLRKTSYNFGFLWNINKYFTLGGVYKPRYRAEVKYKEVYRYTQSLVNVADPTDTSFTSIPTTVIADEKQEMEIPDSYGLGLACRFSDGFTIDLDVYRTEWQHFVLRQRDGREISLITGKDRSLADTKPTHQVRLGAEYLFMLKDKYVVPLRAGIFKDPEPTEKTPDDFYGFSLGGGIAVGSFVFDLAYQYRCGNDVRKVRLGTEEIFQDVEQHTVYASLIFHF